MQISAKIIKEIIEEYNIPITGILHIGSHDCEELSFYHVFLGIYLQNILWIDGNPYKINECKSKGIPNVYHAVITKKDDDKIPFYISNYSQFSGILEMKKIVDKYSDIYHVDTILQDTITIDTFFKKIKKCPKKYVFWTINIQGAELLALQGAEESLKHVKIIYLNVRTEELFKNAVLIGQVEEYLASIGFQRAYIKMTEDHWGDAIYVRVI